MKEMRSSKSAESVTIEMTAVEGKNGGSASKESDDSSDEETDASEAENKADGEENAGKKNTVN